MKETKNLTIEFRLTAKEKELIKEYAQAHNISVSEFIRITCLNKIQQEVNNDGN